jgi:hypothetical protein
MYTGELTYDDGDDSFMHVMIVVAYMIFSAAAGRSTGLK